MAIRVVNTNGKIKITIDGKDVDAFRDVCNAAAACFGIIKSGARKSTREILSKENIEWTNRGNRFLSKLKKKMPPTSPPQPS